MSAGTQFATPQTTSYTARTSVLEDLRTYHLGADALVVAPVPDPAMAAGVPPPIPQSISYADITEIRLRYFPTRVQTNRYECLVSTRRHGKLKIANERFEGVMQFKDQSAEYRPFVTELCRRVASVNPQAKFVRGRAMFWYVVEHGFLLAMFIALAAVFWLVGGYTSYLVWVQLAIIAFYIPFLIQYTRKNRPSTFDPRQVPGDVLPAT